MGALAMSESVLLIPVLEVSDLVGELRLEHDPSARAGVPPHITIIYPFVPPGRIDARVTGDLRRFIEGIDAFDLSLTAVDEFEQGVLYLVPEPGDRFVNLIEAASQRFGLLPFEGVYPEVVPHLTVMQNAPAPERDRVRRMLEPQLPRSCRAAEAWLMTGSNESEWQLRDRFCLRA